MKNYRYTIGVDFGGTYVKLALVRFEEEAGYKIEGYSFFPTKEYSREALIEQLVIRIIKLKAKSTFKNHHVRGIGIGVPGRVDFNRGMVFDLTNVPGWKNVCLREILEKKIKLPVYVDNDANLMALAESKFGAARGYKNCVCVTMGTGIGGGIILGGRIYRGKNFAAGEVGHISINENGPICACGSKGCAERFVGSRYILEEAIKRLKRGAKSSVEEKLHGRYSNLTLEMLSRAARKKDAFSIILWQEVGKHVGVLLASVVNLLNPEVIVIGGGVANAGNLLLDPIRKVVKERAFSVSSRELKIVSSKCKEKAGIIGGAALALTGR
ncbi:MAG: ROK family protein [Candidatus Omnitrophica bacterium]|nr:ROK family protein [Candidatus Omnitrophota bacterium]MBU1924906.1 ROK family protein [Candidatus Omnitrophota bacterium]